MIPDFSSRLEDAAIRNHSWLLIGLDPQINRLPVSLPQDAGGVLEFNKAIIAETRDRAIGYKLNFAFYEALGTSGWHVLRETRRAIPSGMLALADAKRGDIGSTGEMYARSIFDDLDFDAVTVSPYLGIEGVQPFLNRPSKAAFVLCRTSNPGESIQTCQTAEGAIYEVVARRASTWGDNVGLVVGATDIGALAQLRELAPALPFLIPGVGVQGGELERAVQTAFLGEGRGLIAISRSIIFASTGPDFAAAAAREAERLNSVIRVTFPGG